ncbi:BTAD domain-containing putative transcriptional regulator [Anaerotignum sp. MB30-C6]|uniref:BTAD domain-containing putative transcriptional regulator n=1 Tax=Anaerotignum sp. MB30-C6 TaxID=3070814 RepID=UPI0027DC9A27|nr:BTAD domain-containing putative transcriptional regulator [Anaerotignum sp. MB30-C6]WMI82272.1 BTAD domain-containing putative transcriptional regulator [Anaerotignum sp. MB30-C6]
MNEEFRVTMLGEFTIEYGDSIISDQSNRSKKVWTLLEYIIVHRKRFVSQDELIDLLWSDSNSRDPINTLKVLMHRVRSTLEDLDFEDSRRMILYRNGAYGWNQDYTCVTDIDEFQRLIYESDQETEDDARKIALLLQAESLYQGHFLQKKASEPWVIPIANYYRTLYNRVVLDLAHMLFEHKKYEQLASVCQKAILFEPYEEQFYIYLIQVLICTGHLEKALDLYHHVTDLFMKELGVTPSEELRALYKDVVKTIKTPEMNLSVIKSKLDESREEIGCVFCEYEFFKLVYRLETRSIGRTGDTSFLCLISAVDKNTVGIPSRRVLNRSMDALKTTIQYNIRSGDVFTRYSVNQYLIMLPYTTTETANMVAQRLLKVFRKEFPNISIVLKYSTQQIMPKADCFIKD